MGTRDKSQPDESPSLPVLDRGPWKLVCCRCPACQPTRGSPKTKAQATGGPHLAEKDLTRKGQPEKVQWRNRKGVPMDQDGTGVRTASESPRFQLPLPVTNGRFRHKGFGALLSQVLEGEEHPVIYISRKLPPAERNYATI
ncbi:hypothetical protein QQF64_016402 [Cirrhinus molitorella]|uniref:Reverse transcriptase RNase H-like domain-containing protein n=1 Tax=Cirrhinus molitorella TaxID=172907 RepID=A0ABR3LMS4_9TELE